MNVTNAKKLIAFLEDFDNHPGRFFDMRMIGEIDVEPFQGIAAGLSGWAAILSDMNTQNASSNAILAAAAGFLEMGLTEADDLFQAVWYYGDLQNATPSDAANELRRLVDEHNKSDPQYA